MFVVDYQSRTCYVFPLTYIHFIGTVANRNIVTKYGAIHKFMGILILMASKCVYY